MMMKSVQRALAFGLLVSLSGLAAAQVMLKEGHPGKYFVKNGDTLWDISARFLQEPWQWPEIWQINEEISNPHLIYPGDEIRLTYVNGEPRLSVKRGVEEKTATQRHRQTHAESARNSQRRGDPRDSGWRHFRLSERSSGGPPSGD